MVYIYLCIIYPTFVAPWFRRSVYSSILTCSCVWFTTALSQERQELLVSHGVCHEEYRRRQVGECADTWYKQISLLRQCMELWLPGIMPTCLCESKRLMSLLYCCFVTFMLTKARHWTYYSACVSFVDVESYRLTVLRHHWHCCVCSYSHNNYNHWAQARPQYSLNALVILSMRMIVYLC